jgi:hypothetical protein
MRSRREQILEKKQNPEMNPGTATQISKLSRIQQQRRISRWEWMEGRETKNSQHPQMMAQVQIK